MIANTKAEESIGSRNTFQIDAVPAPLVMSALYATTDSSMYSARYDRNCLAVDFNLVQPGQDMLPETQIEQQDDLVQIIWQRLAPLLGRNFSSNTLQQQGGDILKLGAPKFKNMLLPREEVVVTFEFVELWTAAGTMKKFSNRDTKESQREFNKMHSDFKYCSIGFRRFATARSALADPRVHLHE